MTQDQELIAALRQFVEQATILSPDGQYMRYEDGQPVALDVALAKEALQRLEDLEQIRARWKDAVPSPVSDDSAPTLFGLPIVESEACPVTDPPQFGMLNAPMPVTVSLEGSKVIMRGKSS